MVQVKWVVVGLLTSMANWKKQTIEELQARYNYSPADAAKEYTKLYDRTKKQLYARGYQPSGIQLETRKFSIAGEIYASLVYSGEGLIKIDATGGKVKSKFNVCELPIEKLDIHQRFTNFAKQHTEVAEILALYETDSISYDEFLDEIASFKNAQEEGLKAGSG